MKKLTAISALRNFDHELIGQEDIDEAELKPRVNEKVGFAFGRSDFAGLL